MKMRSKEVQRSEGALHLFLRREGKDLSKTLPKNGHQFEKVYLFKHPAFVL